MNGMMKEPCTECGGALRRQSISREFEREGITVKVEGIRVAVCQDCGEVYFEPGGADRLADAVECLFALASAEKQHKGRVGAIIS